MAPSQPNVPDVRHVPTLEGMPRELGMQIVSHVPHEYCRKDDSENKEKADKNKDNADEKKDEADKKYDYFDRSSGLLAIKALSLTCKNLSPLTDEWRLAHLRLETDDPEVLSQRSGRLLKMLEHLGDKVNLIKSFTLIMKNSPEESLFSKGILHRVTFDNLARALSSLPSLKKLVFDGGYFYREEFTKAFSQDYPYPGGKKNKPPMLLLANVEQLCLGEGYGFLTGHCPKLSDVASYNFRFHGNFPIHEGGNTTYQRTFITSAARMDKLQSFEMHGLWSIEAVKIVAKAMPELRVFAPTGHFECEIWIPELITAFKCFEKLEKIIFGKGQMAKAFGANRLPDGVDLPDVFDKCPHPQATVRCEGRYQGDGDDFPYEAQGKACTRWNALLGDGARFLHNEEDGKMEEVPLDSAYTIFRFNHAYQYLAREYSRSIDTLRVMIFDEGHHNSPSLSSFQHGSKIHWGGVDNGRDVGIFIDTKKKADDETRYKIKRDFMRCRMTDGVARIPKRSLSGCPVSTTFPLESQPDGHLCLLGKGNHALESDEDDFEVDEDYFGGGEDDIE